MELTSMVLTGSAEAFSNNSQEMITLEQLRLWLRLLWETNIDQIVARSIPSLTMATETGHQETKEEPPHPSQLTTDQINSIIQAPTSGSANESTDTTQPPAKAPVQLEGAMKEDTTAQVMEKFKTLIEKLKQKSDAFDGHRQMTKEEWEYIISSFLTFFKRIPGAMSKFQITVMVLTGIDILCSEKFKTVTCAQLKQWLHLTQDVRLNLLSKKKNQTSC